MLEAETGGLRTSQKTSMEITLDFHLFGLSMKHVEAGCAVVPVRHNPALILNRLIGYDGRDPRQSSCSL